MTIAPWLGDGTDTSAAAGFQPNPTPVYAPPTHLAFSTQPGGAIQGSLLSPQPVVSVLDAGNHLTPWANSAVTLAIGNNPGGGVLTGTNPRNATGGVATCTDLTITVGGGAGYTLVASAPALASATSSAFDIVSPPVITSQPVSRTNDAGTTATFAVAVSGTAPFSYQWYKNGTNSLSDGGNVTGATSNVLTLANVLGADRADYSVTISNPAATVTSSNATLVVNDPIITAQPVSVTAVLGTTATFAVTATGTTPLSYQWQQNGVGIVGATSSVLALSDIRDSDAGSYAVQVSNGAGTIMSVTVILTITHPPVITSQPASLIVNLGQSATFNVSANGATPFSYQWQKNGTDVGGATGKKLIFGSVLATDTGSYRVVVTNPDGTETSTSATLTVIVPPTITSQPSGLTNNAGTTASFTVVASGTAPSYHWFKNGTNGLSDTGNISGSASNTLTITNVLGADGAAYTVVISNAAGTVTSSAAVLGVIDPIITAQPVSAIANLGAAASFTVAAYGTTPSYQWRKDGTAIAGATTATYAIGSVLDVDGGSYVVVVSNAYGSVTSAPPVSLTVIDPPVITGQPASRTNNAGTTATFAVTVSGTAPLSYQWKKGALTLSDGGNISGATSPILTLTGVSAAEAASYTVFISNAVGNATSIAATLTVIDPPVITSQPLGRTNNAGTTATFTVAATGTAPSYQWFKNGTNSLSDTGNVSGSTSNVLTLAGVFGADRGEYTVVVSNAAGTLTSSNATLVVIDPAILTQPADVTAINGSTVSFTVNAVGTAPLSYRWQVDGFDLVDGFGVSGATTASLTITGIADSDQGAYTVIITNSAGTATSAGAILVTVPPVIVSQPANQTVLVGQAASFSVAVNGALPFSYQWQRDGVNIGGATNRILTISPAALADAGSYRIVVTNPSGVQTSSAATLSVYATAAPTLGSLVSSNGQFSLTLTGVPGFNYTIQASTNLVNWVPLGTNASPFTLVDTNASSFSRRFYRGLYLP